MSKNRIKLPAIAVPQTRAEMEALAGQIARLKIDQTEAAAAMDKEINSVKDRYAAFAGERQAALDARMAAALLWAQANPSEFGKAKSIDMTHAQVGYRTGQPQLKTLKGWTWDRVLEKLMSLPGLQGFVRTKREVDRQLILQRRDDLLPGDLKFMGVQVIQEETFFVEPKLASTEVEKRETAQSTLMHANA